MRIGGVDMQKFLILALVAALVACGPVMAQQAQQDPDSKVKVNVVTKSGGVVVKKVIKDGKVVDEDVEVFGDLDDTVRDKILKMLKEGEKGGCCPRGGIHSWVFPFSKKFSSRLEDYLEDPFQKHIHKHMEKALKGLKKDYGHKLKVHGFTDDFGDKIQMEVKKALKGLDLHGLHFFVPEELKDHIKVFKGGKFPFKARLFKHGKGDCDCKVFKLDDDEGAKSKGRIRIEMNGKTLMDKVFGSEDAGKKITKLKKKTLRPRIKVQREMKSRRSSTDEAIRKLENEIERLQRQLNQLKEELRVRPKRLEHIRHTRTHQL